MTFSLFSGDISPFKSAGRLGQFRRLRRLLYAATSKLLANFDFSAASTSWKTGHTGFSHTNATDEWLFQSHTAGSYANNIGSETLDQDAGTTDQTAAVVCDGIGYGNRECWEATVGTDTLSSTGTTAGNSDNEDTAGCIVFASLDIATNDIFLWNGSHTASAPGIWVRAGATGFKVGVCDGTTISTVSNVNGTFDDGALHYIKWWYDYSADTLYLKSDIDPAGTSGSTAGTTGSILSTSSLIVNGRFIGSDQGPQSAQYSYVGVCVGTGSQSFYEEVFWNHATDPTGLLTTTDRASLISVPLSASTVGHFADDTLPIGYNSAFSDANKLGLYCNSAVTNLVAWSEKVSSWQGANTTKADNIGDSPDGFKAAGSITALSASPNNNAYPPQFAATVAEYTNSVWVKRNQGTDVVCSLRLYDTTNATYITDDAFTATDTWQRVSTTGTTLAGCLEAQLVIRIDTNLESILVWGAQCELGDAATALIRTNGASASLVACKYESDAASAKVNNVSGEIAATFVSHKQSAFYIFHNDSTDTNNNSHINNLDALLRPRSFWYNNAAGIEENHTATASFVAGAESVLRDLWSTDGLDSGAYETAIYINGVRENGSAMPLEGTIDEGTKGLSIGSREGDGTLNMDGVIQSLKVYGTPGAL